MFSKSSVDPRRSLFGRLLLGFMSVMLAIWFGILVWDLYEAKTYRDDTLQDTKNLARQALILIPLAAGRAGEIDSVLAQMEEAREKGFKERGWYIPKLQIQAWKDHGLIYSSDRTLPASRPFATPLHDPDDPDWVSWVETDPQSGMTVSVTQEVTGRWIFTIASVGYYLLPLLYSLPFLLIPAWFIIKAGLRPLRTIVTEIEGRSSASPPSGERSPLMPLAPTPYRELSPLVTSVNRLMQRLSERLEREQEFLLNAAHEMKIPMAIIQLNSEAMLAHADHTAQADHTDQAGLLEAKEGLQQGVTRATHTMHQLLALARSGVDRGHADLQPLDLVELVQDCLAPAAQIAMSRGVEIELHSPETCLLSLHRETAALLIDNLVSNAVKYSPDKGHVSVRIEPDDLSARLIITDEGPGIAPDMRKRVFERFFRLPGQEQPGSGLGLSIAERAASHNHAHIRLAEGAGGKGLTVTVEFHEGMTPQG